MQPHAEEQTQTCVQPEEAQSLQKKQKVERRENTTTLTEDELQELANAMVKFVQYNLGGIRA